MGYAAESGERSILAVKGHYHEAAVGCWFTSQGRGIPQLVKYKDEDSCICTLRDIAVVHAEQRRYTGILMQRYDCRTVVDGIEKEFMLLYHPDSNRWDLVLSGSR